jgi:hypothetical protein
MYILGYEMRCQELISYLYSTVAYFVGQKRGWLHVCLLEECRHPRRCILNSRVGEPRMDIGELTEHVK